MAEIRRFTKRRLALIQMEQSLNLLEAGDPISALTLAGAAEEILGRMVAKKGKKPRVESLADWIGTIYDWAGKKRPSKKKIIAIENRIRNELKHQNDGRNITVEADFNFHCEEMLLRCMYNYFDAFGCFPQNRNLRSWFANILL